MLYLLLYIVAGVAWVYFFHWPHYHKMPPVEYITRVVIWPLSFVVEGCAFIWEKIDDLWRKKRSKK